MTVFDVVRYPGRHSLSVEYLTTLPTDILLCVTAEWLLLAITQFSDAADKDRIHMTQVRALASVTDWNHTRLAEELHKTLTDYNRSQVFHFVEEILIRHLGEIE